MKKNPAESTILAKIILSMNGAVLREIVLSTGRVTIGRRPHNRIVLNDIGVSGRHAVIAAAGDDFYLEDLNSTNGTEVNGQPVGKHFLQHDDIIAIARYQLRYVSGKHVGRGGMSAAAASGVALVRVLEGVGAGREVVLNKVMTTLGRTNEQVAVIVRQADGYLLAPVEGGLPLVNGTAITDAGCFLAEGDIIDMNGARLQFSLS